jgi:hypothetical protein
LPSHWCRDDAPHLTAMIAHASGLLAAQPDPATHLVLLWEKLLEAEWPISAVLAAFHSLIAADLADVAVNYLGEFVAAQGVPGEVELAQPKALQEPTIQMVAELFAANLAMALLDSPLGAPERLMQASWEEEGIRLCLFIAKSSLAHNDGCSIVKELPTKWLAERQQAHRAGVLHRALRSC